MYEQAGYTFHENKKTKTIKLVNTCQEEKQQQKICRQTKFE